MSWPIVRKREEGNWRLGWCMKWYICEIWASLETYRMGQRPSLISNESKPPSQFLTDCAKISGVTKGSRTSDDISRLTEFTDWRKIDWRDNGTLTCYAWLHRQTGDSALDAWLHRRRTAECSHWRPSSSFCRFAIPGTSWNIHQLPGFSFRHV